LFGQASGDTNRALVSDGVDPVWLMADSSMISEKKNTLSEYFRKLGKFSTEHD